MFMLSVCQQAASLLYITRSARSGEQSGISQPSSSCNYSLHAEIRCQVSKDWIFSLSLYREKISLATLCSVALRGSFRKKSAKIFLA
jgi:hypothetical protein